MAENKVLRFKIGDWIVHHNYGVGEVVDIVDKVLDGHHETFFKVSTEDVEYWLPSDKADADHIEPIRSVKDFDQAIEIISKPPDVSTASPSQHRRMLYERWRDGSLPARAALIRDLHGMDSVRKLNYDDKKAFDRAEKFFIMEWIISNPSLTVISAKRLLTEALNLSIQKAKLETQ
jgi:RNA polymerase-interacting CarD/CdnL/TRCF family regulator